MYNAKLTAYILKRFTGILSSIVRSNSFDISILLLLKPSDVTSKRTGDSCRLFVFEEIDVSVSSLQVDPGHKIFVSIH